MNAFTFNTSPSIVFESGAGDRLGDQAKALLGPRCLCITDPGLRQLGLCEPALQSLRRSGHEVTLFDRVEADPSQETLLKAVELGREAGVTGVVGLGGGSSLDVAKLAALLLGADQPLDELWGVGLAQGPRLPLLLVPTTAGTGSEVTPVAIITVGAEEKRGVSSPLLLPDLAVLDPELTLDLPAHITAATGVDAMVHAIEAYTSRHSNNNPLSRNLAREALRLLGGHIERAVADGHDRDARSAMLLGSLLAGQAFANSPVGAVHALAYPVGALYHLPHGLCNALLLPAVMRFNQIAAWQAYAELAPEAFPELAQERDLHARSAAFIDALSHLSVQLGLPQRLRDVDIPEQALAKLAAEAMMQTRLLVNNPRPLSEHEALAIYSEIW